MSKEKQTKKSKKVTACEMPVKRGNNFKSEVIVDNIR